MSKLIFVGNPGRVYDVDFSQIGENQVRLSFNENNIPSKKILLSGFNLVNEYDRKIIQTPREDYNYIYRESDDGNAIELCNDNNPWVSPPEPIPEPIPEPEPYVPTLKEVQEMKVAEMNSIQQYVISEGVTVTLSDGNEEHFTLTEKDQISLFGLKDEVNDGASKLPWHVSDENIHCGYYSPEDMRIITTTAKQFVTYHVTYFRDLRIYIRSLQNKEEVEAIQYGITIPVEYQSEPLKDMMAAQLS